MTDKNTEETGPDAPEGETTMVRVELGPETTRMLSELQPAVELWAATEGGEPATSPADVINLSIAVLHSHVFAGAHAMLAAGEVRPPTQH